MNEEEKNVWWGTFPTILQQKGSVETATAGAESAVKAFRKMNSEKSDE